MNVQGTGPTNRPIINVHGKAAPSNVASNTFVNQYSGRSTFPQIGSADTVPVLARDNIFYGGTLSIQSNTTFSVDFVRNPSFVSLTKYNYNLNVGSPGINYATSEGVSSEDYSSLSAYQFFSPTCGETWQNANDAGGLAYNNSGTKLNCLP